MKALLCREIQLLKSNFGNKFDLQAILIILFPFVFCMVFKMISLFFLIFTAFAFLNYTNLIEEFKIRKGILSIGCTRKEYVKFRFLFDTTNTIIVFIISAVLETIFCKITRRPYISLEYMMFVFLIILSLIIINLIMFFTAKENIFGIALIINIGLIIVIDIFSINGNRLVEKLTSGINFNLINNGIYLLLILIFYIVFIFVAMFISSYFFEKKDL